MESSRELVSIIIVTFNNQETINNCLDSLLKLRNKNEIIVVDNSSTDKTFERLNKYTKEIEIIALPQNLGFSKANNLGVKYSRGDYLLFLNPDTQVLSLDSLNLLRETLESNSELGLIGPKLVLESGQTQKTVRNLPSALNAFKEYILGSKGAYDFYLPESEGLAKVESVVGACMLITKKIFLKVGGFDERYFLYYEDLQLCKDLKDKGFSIGYLSTVSFKHSLGASGKNQPTNKLLTQSAKKYHGYASFYLIQFIFKISQLFKRIK